MSDRFEFIDAQRAPRDTENRTVLPVARMCRLLDVSRSGFYEWRNRPTSATAARREDLARLIVEVFAASVGTYGYRRVHADLAAQGVACGPELVRHLMREQGLRSCQPRPWRFSLTAGDGQVHDIPDLVRRDFTADAPGGKTVGDITYIPTGEGWLYLATVIDCHTRAVIGWAMDDNHKTPLIEAAITMAARRGHLAEGAIFIPTAAATTPPPPSPPPCDPTGFGIPSAGPGSATTTPWPNRSSPPSKTNSSTAPATPHENTPAATSPATSNYTTIPDVVTPRSATAHPTKHTTTT